MSRLTLVELSPLGRKPHGCPAEVETSWNRYVATHRSVSGLFSTLNYLRQQGDPRGSISEDQRDQARAAIVFTAAGIDACLRTLLRNALVPLLRTTGPASKAFSTYVSKRLDGKVSGATKQAILSADPRAALIDLYVTDLTASSIQSWQELQTVRDALGITSDQLEDDVLKTHQPFFSARHEVVHELDLIDPSGKGSRGRRHRDITAVGEQCDGALQMLEDFINPTARAIKAAGNWTTRDSRDD